MRVPVLEALNVPQRCSDAIRELALGEPRLRSSKPDSLAEQAVLVHRGRQAVGRVRLGGGAVSRAGLRQESGNLARQLIGRLTG